MIVAAAVFHRRGLTDVVDLEQVHALLGPLLGSAAPVLFALALLASGLSSSSESGPVTQPTQQILDVQVAAPTCVGQRSAPL